MMLETLVQIDHALSLSINHFHTPWLDTLMTAASGRLTWIPLYILLLFLTYRQFGWRNMLVVLAAAALMILFTDQLSVLMKYHFARPRPCHHPEFAGTVQLVDGCGGKYGFVSSHAANTMGLAVFLGLLLRQGWATTILLLYAFLNGYSRIYLGKHFVLDVAGGYLLGITAGIIFYFLVKYILKRLSFRAT